MEALTLSYIVDWDSVAGSECSLGSDGWLGNERKGTRSPGVAWQRGSDHNEEAFHFSYLACNLHGVQQGGMAYECLSRNDYRLFINCWFHCIYRLQKSLYSPKILALVNDQSDRHMQISSTRSHENKNVDLSKLVVAFALASLNRSRQPWVSYYM